MKSHKFVINLYKLIIINLFLVICLMIFSILYRYVFININISAWELKDDIKGVIRILLSTGISTLIIGIILNKIFFRVYDISEGNLLECVRQRILSEYRLSSREASLRIRSGKKIYAESLEHGLFFKISYNKGKAIIDRLSSGDRTEMECKEISMHDLDVMREERGLSFYESEAYEEMLDMGFTITEY